MIAALFFAAMVSGDWTGTSTCTDLKVLPGCHDEVVIYHFTPRDKNIVHNVADKIVNGKPEFMGEFDMTQDGKRIYSEMDGRQGKVLWEFFVDGNHITGTARFIQGNKVFRKIDVRKKP